MAYPEQQTERLSDKVPVWLQELWLPPDLRRRMQVPGLAVPLSEGLSGIIGRGVKVEGRKPYVAGAGRIGLKPVLVQGTLVEGGLAGEIVIAGRDRSVPEDRITFVIPDPDGKKRIAETMREARSTFLDKMWQTVKFTSFDEVRQELFELRESWWPHLGPLWTANEEIERGENIIFFTGQRAYLNSLDCIGIKTNRIVGWMADLAVRSMAWQVRAPVLQVEGVPSLFLDRVTYTQTGQKTTGTYSTGELMSHIDQIVERDQQLR